MEAKATPRMLESFLREMIKGSEWEGKVFLVGGFVRDELLGKEPKDADIVVGKPQGGIEFTTWLGKKLNIYKEGSNPVIYPTFGTANLRLDGVIWNGIDFAEESVDAVMFRKEQYHDPSTRKPTVQYTPDIRIDASRRDLTFNALYKNISSGQIIDPTGKGIADLKNRIVRTSIDPTIIYTDDALRMFRAVRFAIQLGFELAPEIIDGIKKNLHRLGNTSKERIRDELNKILVSKNPARGIRLLRDTGLLPYVAKELQQAIGMTQNIHHTQDVFDHTLTVLMGTQPEIVRRLMALFHDIGKIVTRSETPTGIHFYGHEDVGPEIAERIMRNLKYPNELIAAVKTGVRNHMRLKPGGDEAKLSDKTLRKFKIELGDQLEHVLDLIHADNISHADASAMPNQIANVRARLKALDIQVKKPTLPINGHDLIAMGIPEGPIIGKILGAITDAWYDNPNITREEAITIAKGMISEQKVLGEIKSPYRSAKETDKRRGYIGVVHDEIVHAYDEMVPDVLEVDHSEFPFSRLPLTDRFRYFAIDPKNTIIWNDFLPSNDVKIKVDDWLAEKGIQNVRHAAQNLYDYLKTGRWI
jgi:putative nucleotidyltransferase with HDIG domain